MRTNYAVVLARLNLFVEARQQIDAALDLDPKSAEAHNFRGSLLERAGETKQALAEFLDAIGIRPEYPLAHLNTGRMLAQTGNSAAARLHLQQAALSRDLTVRQQAAGLLEKISAAP